MPKPSLALNGRFCNTAWQVPNDRALILQAAADPTRDVLFFVEARSRGGDPLPISRWLDERVWLVVQDDRDDERGASVIAIRRSWLVAHDAEVVNHGTKLISRSGPGVQDRHLLDVEVVSFDYRPLRLIAMHLALAKTGRQDDGVRVMADYVTTIRRQGDDYVIASDVNQDPALFAARIWSAFKGRRRWGFFYSWRLRGTRFRVLSWIAARVNGRRLTDSPFLDVDLDDGGTTPAPRTPSSFRPGRVPRRRRPRRNRRGARR